MKQKDFYYSMLYIYDKVLAAALAEDFAKSGERSKSGGSGGQQKREAFASLSVCPTGMKWSC